MNNNKKKPQHCSTIDNCSTVRKYYIMGVIISTEVTVSVSLYKPL